LRESYNQIVADATGRPLEKVLDDVSRDFWLSASEALEYGLANKIIVRHAEL
jgi:ATP-dependent Clp protease protease subunit